MEQSGGKREGVYSFMKNHFKRSAVQEKECTKDPLSTDSTQS